MRPSKFKLPRISARTMRIALLGLCVLFASLALWAAIDLAARGASYRAAEREYDEIAALARPVGNGSPAGQGSGGGETDAELPAIDFSALADINPDICAWIILPGSVVDYPVVQGENNQYYLTRTFRGEKNSAGAIFWGAYNARDFSDKNTMIYGHYMRSGTMFQVLERYKEQGFYEANPEFWLLTPQGAYRCTVFAAYVTTAKSEAYIRSFSDDAAMQTFLDTAAERSLIQGAVMPTPQDRILTLSTCDYTFYDARMVVQAAVERVG